MPEYLFYRMIDLANKPGELSSDEQEEFDGLTALMETAPNRAILRSRFVKLTSKPAGYCRYGSHSGNVGSTWLHYETPECRGFVVA